MIYSFLQFHLNGKLLYIKVSNNTLSYVYPSPGVAIKRKGAKEAWENESKHYVKIQLDTQTAVGAPQTCPEQTLAWMAVSHSKKRVGVYQGALKDLSDIGYDLLEDSSFCKYLSAFRSIKSRPNIKAKPNITLVAYRSGTADNEVRGSTGVHFYGSTRKVDSRTLINEPEDSKCKHIDDEATALLREHGYFN